MPKNMRILHNARVMQSCTDGALFIDQGDGVLHPVGGGGASSWNDLTDKPFGSTIERITLVEETTVTIATVEQPAYVLFTVDFKPDTTYLVTFDGETYECVPYLIPGLNRPGIGNSTIAGASGGNGEPFLYVVGGPDGECMLGAETIGNHTIKIETDVEVVTPIDTKYLPTADIAIEVDDIGSTDFTIDSFTVRRLDTDGIANKVALCREFDVLLYNAYPDADSGVRLTTVKATRSQVKVKADGTFSYGNFTFYWRTTRLEMTIGSKGNITSFSRYALTETEITD